jgi:hypothetical protein
VLCIREFISAFSDLMLRKRKNTTCDADFTKQASRIALGFALDIPLKSSGIWNPEFRSQKPECQAQGGELIPASLF